MKNLRDGMAKGMTMGMKNITTLVLVAAVGMLSGCGVKDWLYGKDKTQQPPATPEVQLSQKKLCNRILARVTTYNNKVIALNDKAAGSYRIQLQRQFFYERMDYFTDLSFRLNCNRLKFADAMLKADPLNKLFPEEISTTVVVE